MILTNDKISVKNVSLYLFYYNENHTFSCFSLLFCFNIKKYFLFSLWLPFYRCREKVELTKKRSALVAQTLKSLIS